MLLTAGGPLAAVQRSVVQTDVDLLLALWERQRGSRFSTLALLLSRQLCPGNPQT